MYRDLGAAQARIEVLIEENVRHRNTILELRSKIERLLGGNWLSRLIGPRVYVCNEDDNCGCFCHHKHERKA